MDDTEVETRFRELVSRWGSSVALAERAPRPVHRRPVRARPPARAAQIVCSPNVVVLRLTAALSTLGMLGLGAVVADRVGPLLWIVWLLLAVPGAALLVVTAVGWLLAARDRRTAT